MYSLFTANTKTEKRLREILAMRKDIKEKLKNLQDYPRKAAGAHPLHGKLAKKWACWLGSNLRMIYTIDDEKKNIIIIAIGTHKIY